MCETEGTTSQFSISLNPDDPSIDSQSVPEKIRRSFQEDGFVSFREVLDMDDVNALNDRLEKVLRGEYDRQQKPDKAPRLLKSGYQARQFDIKPPSTDGDYGGERSGENISKKRQSTLKPKIKGCAKGPLGFSGNLSNVKVLQLINVHKCDTLFRKLATNSQLGKVICQLTGWEAVRLAQDQVWAKPPGAPPLVFHRDTPYFMFDRPSVVTVWIALDTMDAELGPLEYVKGSHLWGEGRVGTSRQFYQHTGSMKLMLSAAEKEGLSADDLDIVSMAGFVAGSISIHDGRTWHGSGRNASETRPRRGLGLHFVPKGVKFTDDARHSKLWRSYWESGATELCEEDFPITWQPT